jgi:uncharacterized protein
VDDHRPDYAGAQRYASERLERELSPSLYYHNLYHTHEDILPAAERLAHYEGVSRSVCGLLLCACYYHDLGFTISPVDHEARSARIAGEVLPEFGFSPAQIHIIQGCIMVTRVFTPPRSILEAIIVDADLDVLGRPDFLPRSVALRQENTEHGHPTSDEQWYRQQLNFLNQHQYRTISAQALRGPHKQQNKRELIEILNQLASPAL